MICIRRLLVCCNILLFSIFAHAEIPVIYTDWSFFNDNEKLYPTLEDACTALVEESDTFYEIASNSYISTFLEKIVPEEVENCHLRRCLLGEGWGGREGKCYVEKHRFVPNKWFCPPHSDISHDICICHRGYRESENTCVQDECGNDERRVNGICTKVPDESTLPTPSMCGPGETSTPHPVYLPTASGPMPVAAHINGRLYAIHSDHLNTPRRLTDQQGRVVWQWLITGFGEVQPDAAEVPADDSEGVTFDLRYPGQQWDEESALAYNLHRYYDPDMGRYIQADPIGLDGGWNRFLYGEGNPISYIDTDGFQARPPMGTAVRPPL